MRRVEISLLVLGVLLAMAQHSMQFSSKNPNIPHKIRYDKPAIGIILTSSNLERVFLPYITPNESISIQGRTFETGKIFETPVVSVTSAGTPSVHVGITAQIMVENFELEGIIGVGLAGATNETIELGSVVVNKLFVFTGAWDWLSFNSTKEGHLNFGDYNHPFKGKNLLGSIEYEPSQSYNQFGELDTDISLPVDFVWLRRYASIVRIRWGKVIEGWVGSSSDIYVNNSAYKEFLYEFVGATTVDTSSFAIGLVAYTNNLRFIAFQGISNAAGADSGSEESDSRMALLNVSEAVTIFISLLRH